MGIKFRFQKYIWLLTCFGFQLDKLFWDLFTLVSTCADVVYTYELSALRDHRIPAGRILGLKTRLF